MTKYDDDEYEERPRNNTFWWIALLVVCVIIMMAYYSNQTVVTNTVIAAPLPATTTTPATPAKLPELGKPFIWYYTDDNNKKSGPYTGCASPDNDSKKWVMLPAYIGGTGKENIHWKYTENADDPDCLNNWTYYDKDKKTILETNIKSITKKGDSKNWCALPVYKKGNPEHVAWTYC